jgi:hypothetical protein
MGWMILFPRYAYPILWGACSQFLGLGRGPHSFALLWILQSPRQAIRRPIAIDRIFDVPGHAAHEVLKAKRVHATHVHRRSNAWLAKGRGDNNAPTHDEGCRESLKSVSSWPVTPDITQPRQIIESVRRIRYEFLSDRCTIHFSAVFHQAGWPRCTTNARTSSPAS